MAAARLRTLPLSMAGIITGNALAIGTTDFSWFTFMGALATAISYQVLSNFANDYGDGIKGTDNDKRVGPKRVLQQKWLSQQALFRGIIWTGTWALLLSIVLIYGALGTEKLIWSLTFMGLAFLSIWAAYSYTIGKRAYGYHALGDLFVFIFFGGVAVCGSYFLQVQSLSGESLLYAMAIGGLSVGVLNLNNLRDIENDRLSQKKTLASILGWRYAKGYQIVLIISSICAVGLAQLPLTSINYWRYVPLLVVLPLSYQLFTLVRIRENHAVDRLLKPLALVTFGLSLLVFFTKIMQII